MPYNNDQRIKTIGPILDELARLSGIETTPNTMPEAEQAMVREICHKTGDPVPRYLIAQEDGAASLASSTRKPYGDKGTAIIVNTKFTEYFGDTGYGVLAHELGHIHYSHYDATKKLYGDIGKNAPEEMTVEEFAKIHDLSYTQEFEADAFAADWGYGEQLIASFDIPDQGGYPRIRSDSWTHPSDASRVAQIREHMRRRPSQRKAA